MNIIVVDDVSIHRKLLIKDLIKIGEEIELIHEASNADEFIQLLKKIKPEIVFLDIELGKMSAFKVLEKIKDWDFEIIITTGHIQYAIEAYKYNVTDYLVKPIQIQMLGSAIEKAKEKIYAKKIIQNEENLSNQDSKEPRTKKHILLSDQKAKYKRLLSDIVFIKSSHPYCTFHFVNDKPITVSNSIGKYELELAPFDFFRIQSNCLVNLFHVNSYINATEHLKLSTGEELRVARDRKKLFIKALTKISIN